MWDAVYIVLGVLTAFFTMIGLAENELYNTFGDYIIYVLIGLVVGLFWPIAWIISGLAVLLMLVHNWWVAL